MFELENIESRLITEDIDDIPKETLQAYSGVELFKLPLMLLKK